LTPYSDLISGAEHPYYHHVSARQLRDHFKKMGWDWDGYFKFSFVRNPWDRMVSHFCHIRNAEWMIAVKKYEDFQEWCEKSFEDYRRWKEPLSMKLRKIGMSKGLREKVSQEEKHLRLVWDNHLNWIADETGEMIIDFCGRYERLDEDFREICARIGIPDQKLPRLNCDGSAVEYHASLIPVPRYAADHVGAPLDRSAAQDAAWRTLLRNDAGLRQIAKIPLLYFFPLKFSYGNISKHLFDPACQPLLQRL